MTKGNFKNMRWIIIGLCFLANAINYIDRANLAIAAPHIRAELALDPATMGVIIVLSFGPMPCARCRQAGLSIKSVFV